jgi:hypothetical protein
MIAISHGLYGQMGPSLREVFFLFYNSLGQQQRRIRLGPGLAASLPYAQAINPSQVSFFVYYEFTYTPGPI